MLPGSCIQLSSDVPLVIYLVFISVFMQFAKTFFHRTYTLDGVTTPSTPPPVADLPNLS
jgi:hypothetical protein